VIKLMAINQVLLPVSGKLKLPTLQMRDINREMY
jgi:hypothetical protein